ncbi:hypothetical protein NPX13_g6314 [Xylaria arbuscula]|uniref:Kinesin light chain n=1 Tax=Xylaria arbuscula TaxID=114810 RepID=A0A9W8TLJ1_9PEZI|nr:hypothetical protein NPX13_g6314 [Xylaria arbuscula]
MHKGKQTYGRGHPRVLSGMGHMALVLLNQGRLQAAAKWAYKVISISKAMLDQGDTQSLNLEAVIADLLERVTKVLGHEHPGRLIHMHNLALIWNCLGRPWEAKDLLTSCVELQ